MPWSPRLLKATLSKAGAVAGSPATESTSLIRNCILRSGLRRVPPAQDETKAATPPGGMGVLRGCFRQRQRSRQGPAQGRGTPPHWEGASADHRPACAGAAATGPTVVGGYMLLWTVQVFAAAHTFFGKPHSPDPPSILHVSVLQ